MSTNLYWRVVEPEEYFGKDLKYVIAEKYWGHDGTLHGDWVVFTKDDIPYLQGIADTKGHAADEATKLIRMIEKYDEVELCLKG